MKPHNAPWKEREPDENEIVRISAEYLDSNGFNNPFIEDELYRLAADRRLVTANGGVDYWVDLKHGRLVVGDPWNVSRIV